MIKSIDTTQRRLFVLIILATLLASAIVIGDLARGGRADPPSLRAAATLLDGGWRFHTGDDLHWADARADDSDWETIDLTAQPGSHDGDVGLPDYVSGWMAHGHPGYTGYAWYRRAVNVPAGRASWDILGPTVVEDGYELYWNGQLLGGSGRLGPHPRVVGTRPLRFALPADAAGTRGVLALRVFMLPRPGPSATGGGMHSAPILAPRPISDGLHRAQWERTIAGYIVDAIEPLAMFSLIGLALWCWPRSSHKGFLIFASIALALTAARRLNNALVSWTDLMDLPTYSLLAKFMWMPTVAAWALAWNRWRQPPWRTIDVLALAIMVAADRRRRDSLGERDQRQPSRIHRPLCHDRRAHRPRRSDADSRPDHVGIDNRRILRRRVARSDRRTGHLVSVRHRGFADAIHLRDLHSVAGLPDRANLGRPSSASGSHPKHLNSVSVKPAAAHSGAHSRTRIIGEVGSVRESRQISFRISELRSEICGTECRDSRTDPSSVY